MIFIKNIMFINVYIVYNIAYLINIQAYSYTKIYYSIGTATILLNANKSLWCFTQIK